MYKAHQRRTTLGSWGVQKVHAVVARSTFQSQIKVLKADGLALLEVGMSKKCTPLWREAHFQVKMYKAHHARKTFGSWEVEKVHAVVARSTFRSQKCKKLTGSEHFGRSDVVLCGRCKGLCTLSKVSKTWGFCSSFNYNHDYTTLHYTTPRSTTLHYTAAATATATALRRATLHYTTLRYTTPHHTTLH